MSEALNAPMADESSHDQLNDCWNSIGVRGDRSCPELKQHVHCRNCPVYSTAANKLLDADVSSEQLVELTSHYAEARDQDDDAETESGLIFRLGVEWLALSTNSFVEVTSARTVHSLPHRRNNTIVGLVNVRGSLLVVVSFFDMLGIDRVSTSAASNSRTKEQLFLVLKGEGGRVVVPVDEVLGVERFNLDTLKEVPATVAKATATYTNAVLDWDDKAVAVLDENLLFHTINRSMK